MSVFSAMQDLPVSPAEFAALMSRYEAKLPSSMAVGVSGGADSLALLVLLSRYCAGGLFALSVDHGLRAEAAQEVRHVARVARRLDVPHVILRHRGASFSSQASARDIRFDLLTSWCRRNRVSFCALGHHQADQAETFLFRLARGSGVDGLAAMHTERIDQGVHFIRPLLDVPRARLEAVLLQAGVSWREDPSNHDPAYSRTHLGRALDVLADGGLSADRLARASAGAARLREMLSEAAADFLRCESEFASGGYCWLGRDAFYALPRPLGERVLGDILRRIGGRTFRPSATKLDNFYRGLGAGRTLAGCRIVPRGARLLIFREFADIGAPIGVWSGGEAIWDRRFRVRVSGDFGERFEVAPLGFAPLGFAQLGFAQLGGKDVGDIETSIPPIVRPCLPALWREGCLVSVPHLGLAADRLAVASRFLP